MGGRGDTLKSQLEYARGAPLTCRAGVCSGVCGGGDEDCGVESKDDSNGKMTIQLEILHYH